MWGLQCVPTGIIQEVCLPASLLASQLKFHGRKVSVTPLVSDNGGDTPTVQFSEGSQLLNQILGLGNKARAAKPLGTSAGEG